MSESKITEKIISDAEERAERIVADARRRADEIISEAELKAAGKVDGRLAAANAQGEDVLRRYGINARLECGKRMLAAKLNALNGVFDKALGILVSLPKADYVAFIGRLLEMHAEEGDGVVLSKNCNCRAEIASLDIVRKRGLIIEKSLGDFAGGAVLVGKKCDKNLTFEALIEAAKEKKQAELAEKIFG